MLQNLRGALGALLASLCLFGAARAAWDCLPSALPVRSATTPYGNAYAWWCKTSTDAATGVSQWRINYAGVPNQCRDAAKFAAAAARVVAAADPVAAANAELATAAASCTPAPGSADEYEVKRLAWLACGEAIKPPLPATFATAPTCGDAPVLPPPVTPPAAQYIVSGLVAYPLRADGTRSITAWPQAPVAGEAADAPMFSFGVRFCRVPRLSTAAQTVVAGCKVKP